MVAILMSMIMLAGCGSQAVAPENTVESTQEETKEDEKMIRRLQLQLLRYLTVVRLSHRVWKK